MKISKQGNHRTYCIHRTPTRRSYFQATDSNYYPCKKYRTIPRIIQAIPMIKDESCTISRINDNFKSELLDPDSMV